MYTKTFLFALVASFVILNCESYRMKKQELYEEDRENDDIDRLIRELDRSEDRNRPSSSINGFDDESEDSKPQKPRHYRPKELVPNCRRWSLC